MNRLDSRTWLTWGICCMVPLLIGRHPILVVAMACIVVAVRIVCMPASALRWGWIIRIAILFAAIGVVFNALTVRSGNQIAFHLPMLDWPITWNAIAYGVVSGMAMVTLVLIGITTAAGLSWIALTRVLPARMAPLAVSGSVAWSFLPAASQAFTDIREAQAARGHRIRSGRDVLPIVVPLLDGSLGRALTMSETLEARGFGASSQDSAEGNSLPIFGALAIVGALLMAFAISMNAQRLIWLAALITIVGVIGFVKTPTAAAKTTRYREHHLTRADIGVIVACATSLVMVLVIASWNQGAIIFNPYPNLEVPAMDYRILLALLPLFGPALFPYQGEQS